MTLPPEQLLRMDQLGDFTEAEADEIVRRYNAFPAVLEALKELGYRVASPVWKTTNDPRTVKAMMASSISKAKAAIRAAGDEIAEDKSLEELAPEMLQLLETLTDSDVCNPVSMEQIRTLVLKAGGRPAKRGQWGRRKR